MKKALTTHDYSNVHEFSLLGCKYIVHVSAAHNLGMKALNEAIVAFIEQKEDVVMVEHDDAETTKDDMVRVAILGKPNAGKSTLFNKLFGEQKSLTHDTAGTTRDPIIGEIEHKGTLIQVTDTAGLRRRSKVVDNIEKLSVNATVNQINPASVVVLILDALHGITHQDTHILNLAISEGKAVIIIVNKWDLIKTKSMYKKSFLQTIDQQVYNAKKIEIMFLSAKCQKDITYILDKIMHLHALSSMKFQTSILNKILQDITSSHLPPMMKSGRRVRLKYITQIGITPPSFVIFSNSPKDVDDGYRKYLYNALACNLDLASIPIFLTFKDSSKDKYK